MANPDADAVEYAQRLGPLSPRQFQAALSRLDLGDFIEAAPTAGGLFGQNVFVTSTRGRFVLRGNALWDSQFPSEEFFARHLHERTKVPTPWPYLVDLSEDIFGWSYVIMPRLPGVPADALTYSPDDQREIARDVGRNLALMQDFTWPVVGDYNLKVGGIAPSPHGYTRWLVDFLISHTANCQKVGCITADEAQWINQLISEGVKAFEIPFQPTAVQNDYRPGNMLVDRVDGRWRVSGQFDLAEFRIGHPESDLVRALTNYGHGRAHADNKGEMTNASAFVAGYRELRALAPGYEARFKLHMLRDNIINWEYGHTQASWFPRELTFRTWSQALIDGGLAAFESR